MELTEEQVKRALEIAREKLAAKPRNVVIRRVHTEPAKVDIYKLIEEANHNYIVTVVAGHDRHNS